MADAANCLETNLNYVIDQMKQIYDKMDADIDAKSNITNKEKKMLKENNRRNKEINEFQSKLIIGLLIDSKNGEKRGV